MKKGFTLIELLAVIVILAIIALIATPIVLNIINDTKESATLRSADFYLDGVEYAISKKILNGATIEDGEYSITEDGNVCMGTLNDNACTGDIMEIEVDGEKPTGGKVNIQEGSIVSYEIEYGDVTVKKENLISFTIEGTTYQAEEGMTWGEWIESDYNTGGFTNYSGDHSIVVDSTGKGYHLENQDEVIVVSNIIVSNGVYLELMPS